MMQNHYSKNVWDILVCPNCKNVLKKVKNTGAECTQCNSIYKYTDTGSLDLRLQTPKTYQIDYTLGTHLPKINQKSFTPLVENPNPEVNFSEADVPFHLTRELMSYFPKAKTENSVMLDLGCGDAIHKDVCEYAGFEFVGLDYEARKAPFLGDAHSLPFKNNSFEFILSIAVLEHIRFPFVMMREAYRVLLPGGKFIGTVAFLEPFHLNSFYHHSHLGTLNSLKFVGFKIDLIAPGKNWSALRAQSFMSLFPGMPRRLIIALISPLIFIHKLWWRARKIKNQEVNLNDPIRNTTGAFTFIATK